MMIKRVIILLFLIFLINANPINQTIKQYKIRQRRSVDFKNWQSADILFKQLYMNKDNHVIEIDGRMKRSEISRELRPVEGPINIENVPAMLAARKVKRYPYSQKDDPNIIGR